MHSDNKAPDKDSTEKKSPVLFIILSILFTVAAGLASAMTIEADPARDEAFEAGRRLGASLAAPALATFVAGLTMLARSQRSAYGFFRAFMITSLVLMLSQLVNTLGKLGF